MLIFAWIRGFDGGGLGKPFGALVIYCNQCNVGVRVCLKSHANYRQIHHADDSTVRAALGNHTLLSRMSAFWDMTQNIAVYKAPGVIRSRTKADHDNRTRRFFSH